MNIQIQTSTICNARCILCPYKGSWLHNNPHIMSDTVFISVIQKLKKIKNIGRICLYLMNEPFTDSKLLDRLFIVKKELDFTHIEISTNAELLNREVIDRLQKMLANVKYDFIVSVQGASYKQHKEMMQINPAKVWENLKYLNTRIDFRIHGCGTPERKTKNTKEFYTAKNFMEYIKNNMPESFNKIQFFGYNDRASQIENSYACSRPYEDCSRLHNWLHIWYDGQIGLCCVDYNRQYLFGNILDYDSPEDFHKSPKFRSFCVDYYNKTEGLLCNKCSMV